MAIFGPLRPPWRPQRSPHPSFWKLTKISYKISSNETDHRLLAQSVWEILRKQLKILVNFGRFGAPVDRVGPGLNPWVGLIKKPRVGLMGLMLPGLMGLMGLIQNVVSLYIFTLLIDFCHLKTYFV